MLVQKQCLISFSLDTMPLAILALGQYNVDIKAATPKAASPPYI